MDKELIKALESYRKVAERELKKAKGNEEKRINKVIDKNRALLEEYTCENDVENAYGWGLISYNKRNKILSLLNDVNKDNTENKSSYTYLIDMYERDILDINRELLLIKENSRKEVSNE